MDITLRSGNTIPLIGFGPGIIGYSAKMISKRGRLSDLLYRAYNKFIKRPYQKKEYIKSVIYAFNSGYRLLDYSNAYGNQDVIGEVLRKCKVERKDLFLTSRISNQAQLNSYVREEFLKTLKLWNVDTIDLLQFHWPVTGKYIETWKEMIKLKDEGYVRILGVANCNIHHLVELEKATGVVPEINQVEVHPLFTQKELIEYCKNKKIQVEAYTPVGRYDDRLVRLPLLKQLEKKYNKTLVQIILRWHVQNGVIPVIRSLNPSHQKSNIDIFDFELTKDDMEKIDSININSRLRYDPDNCDFSIL